MGRVDKGGESVNLVFKLDGVICAEAEDYEKCRPLANVTEFMQWLKKESHHITIWASRPNNLGTKLDTEKWLSLHQIPYDRLLFDRPTEPIFVNDTPPNAKYYRDFGDNTVVAMLFDEWVEEIKSSSGIVQC